MNFDQSYKYISNTWNITNCFQSGFAECEEFKRVREFKEYHSPYLLRELFPAMFILDLLYDSQLEAKTKNDLLDLLRNNSTKEGLYSYFVDERFLPPDVDDTALALASLIKANRISVSAASYAVDQILSNVSPEGIIEVFFVSDGPLKGEIDPVVCANALYVIYMLGKENQAKKTESFVYETLQSGNYPYLYYPSEDMFLYMVSRLVHSFPEMRKKFGEILSKRVVARIGSSEDPIDLAARVIAGKSVGIKNASESKKLLDLQNEDGSWRDDVFFQAKRPSNGKLYFYGSKEVTTAFAIRALH